MKLRHAIVFSILILPTAGTHGGDIATERTQWANGAIMTAIQQVSATIRDAQEAIAEIEDRMRTPLDAFDLLEIPDIQPIIDLLNQVEDVIAEGQALAHTSAGLEDKMKERFKSYELYLQDLLAGAATLADGTPILDANGVQVDGMSREAYVERYKTWSATHDETVRNILRAHGLQAEQYDTEKARFEVLQEKSRTAEGRMEALQVGNEIANETLTQLQKLREIMMEQSSLHASYFAKKRAMEAEQTARATINTLDIAPIDPVDGTALGF